MARDIETILKITNAEILLYSGENKIYKFTNSDYPPKEEYIYIPMTFDKKDRFKACTKHLENPKCKGIFINIYDMYTDEYLDLLYKYSPENVFAVRNIYNAGFEIAKIIANDINIKTILVIGTDNTEDICSQISDNFKTKRLKYSNVWQKSIDEILRADNNTEIAILEDDFSRSFEGLLADIKENAIILFSKISYINYKTYNSKEIFEEHCNQLIQNNPSKVYISENNDLLKLQTLKNVVVSDNIVELFFKDLGITDYKNTNSLVCKNKKIYIETSVSPYTIRNSFIKFLSSNISKKKIIILHNNPYFSKSQELPYYQNILENINDENVILVSIGIKDMNYIRKSIGNPIIKEFEGLCDSVISDVKHYLKYISDKNTVYYIASGDERLCSIL